MPPHPAPSIRALRACRDAMIALHGQVRPFGPVYSLASGVVTAIDALADRLTGQERYFHAGGSTASPDRLKEDARWRAMEEGEVPWEP